MIDLTAQTTFRLPFQAATVIELASLETAATQLQDIDAPALVLAGGSNWIQLDPTFLGTVIRPRLMHCHAETVQDEVRLRVGAGVLWHQLVMDTLASGWYGLENLALIPGWVGAAPIQNIGAYGVELRVHGCIGMGFCTPAAGHVDQRRLCVCLSRFPVQARFHPILHS
jgi:UDP-N-acetylmuramate dehydrogenase